jgi:hypothetical protein
VAPEGRTKADASDEAGDDASDEDGDEGDDETGESGEGGSDMPA